MHKIFSTVTAVILLLFLTFTALPSSENDSFARTTLCQLTNKNRASAWKNYLSQILLKLCQQNVHGLLAQITPVTTSQPTGEVIRLWHINDVVSALGLTTDWHVRRVAVDADNTHIALLLNHAMEGARVYKDDQLLLSLPAPVDREPVIFQFTADGHLLHSVKPGMLYFDDTLMTNQGTTESFRSSTEAAVYDGQGLAFAEADRVVYETVADGSKQTFDHTGLEIQLIKRFANDIYYSVKDGTNFFLYKNGKRLYEIPLSNPWGYLISRAGDVYFFSPEGTGDALYRNDQKEGLLDAKGAYITQDPQGAVWVTGYRPKERTLNGVSFQTSEMLVKRDGTSATNVDLATLDGAIAFAGNQFALRVAPGNQPTVYFSWPPLWQLLKNGRLVGEPFSFGPEERDFIGMHFSNQGTVFMRNKDTTTGRWCLFADGRKILTDTAQDVLFFSVNGSVVSVYATKVR